MHPDFRRFSDQEVDAAVRVALQEVDLADSYRISIRALVRSRAVNWRSCCGGSCNPCIGRIEEAVDLARQVLLEGPEAPPAPVAPDSAAVASTPADVPAPVAEDDEESEDRNWGLDYR